MGIKQLIYFTIAALIMVACGSQRESLPLYKGYNADSLLTAELVYFESNSDAYAIEQKIILEREDESQEVSMDVAVTALKELKALELNRITGNSSYILDTAVQVSDTAGQMVITYALREGERSPLRILIIRRALTGDMPLMSFQLVRYEENILFTTEQVYTVIFREGHVSRIILNAKEESLFTEPIPFRTTITLRKYRSFTATL